MTGKILWEGQIMYQTEYELKNKIYNKECK